MNKTEIENEHWVTLTDGIVELYGDCKWGKNFYLGAFNSVKEAQRWIKQVKKHGFFFDIVTLEEPIITALSFRLKEPYVEQAPLTESGKALAVDCLKKWAIGVPVTHTFEVITQKNGIVFYIDISQSGAKVYYRPMYAMIHYTSDPIPVQINGEPAKYDTRDGALNTLNKFIIRLFSSGQT